MMTSLPHAQPGRHGPVRLGVLAVTMLTAMAVLSACSTGISGVGHSGGQPSTAGSLPTGPTGPTGPTSTSSPPSSSTSTSAAPTKSPAKPVPTVPVRTATVNGDSGATYDIKVWVEDMVADCAAHAYGTPVIAFLTAHPCTGGAARLLATTTVSGHPVAISRSTLGFSTGSAAADYQTASDFAALVTADGTGNIEDLLRTGARFPGGPAAVPDPNAFLALTQDAGVQLYECWYLDGPTKSNDPTLEAMEQDVTLQF